MRLCRADGSTGGSGCDPALFLAPGQLRDGPSSARGALLVDMQEDEDEGESED